jgi:hypothetical protein
MRYTRFEVYMLTECNEPSLEISHVNTELQRTILETAFVIRVDVMSCITACCVYP